MELFFLFLLIVLMGAALASGYPVAFALPGAAITTILLASGAGALFAGDATAYFAQGGAREWLSSGVTNFRGVYWEVERDTLIAIPLFVFMGIMLQRSKIAEDLLMTMAKLFGPIPGGLGISVVFVGALLAATTGILGATVVAMGLISLPAMLRNNYSAPLATGTIAASGTLGQIIPPSIVLIILVDQLSSAVDQASTARQALYKASTGNFGLPSEFGVISTSAGDMFLGALVPGLILVGLYMAFILIFALIKPNLAPSVPFTEKVDRKLILNVIVILVPPLALIFAVLGSIIAGIATVNQAGAIGAVGATIMAGYRLKEGQKYAFAPAIIAIISLIVIGIIISNFDTNIRSITNQADEIATYAAMIAVGAFLFSLFWSLWRVFKIEDTLRGVMVDTSKTTSLVFIILLGAAMLTAAFRAFGGEELVREFLTSLPGGFWTQFIIVMVVIFLLGFFLDFIEIAVVVVPIVAPILLMDPSANITAVWLGVMIGLNMQTSFLTPPFGFALFYLRGVADKAVKTIDIYKGVVPFIGLQLLALVIVGSFPQLVNYLPLRISLTSETAPPPSNPRLQYCMEQFVSDEFNENGDVIRNVITKAREMPIDLLSKDHEKAMSNSFDAAEDMFGLLVAIKEAEAIRTAAEPDYAPLHKSVRRIEARIRKIDHLVKEKETAISRSNGENIDNLSAQVDKLQIEKEGLITSVPADWDERHKAYVELITAENKARKAYRNAGDTAYEPVLELKAVLAQTDMLAPLQVRSEAVFTDIGTKDNDEIREDIKTLVTELRIAKANNTVIKSLTKVRKLLKKKKLKIKKIDKEYQKMSEAFSQDIAWRSEASGRIVQQLDSYDAGIQNTIGLRLLTELPRKQALYIANCNAHHRDISLSF